MISRAEHEAADYAGSQWADDNDLSQPCHWLNETIKEARAALAQPCSSIPVEEVLEVLKPFAEWIQQQDLPEEKPHITYADPVEVVECGHTAVTFGDFRLAAALYQRLKGVSDAK